MLLVVQLPIADARCFVPGGPKRLPLPTWRVPATARQFVRHFGPVLKRRSGGHDFWPDEIQYCRAGHAFKFNHLELVRLGSIDVDGKPTGGMRPRCAFRRLFCNGDATTRLEVGLTDRDVVHEPWSSIAASPLDAEGCVALGRDALQLEVRVATPRATGFKTVKMRDASQPLAALFEHATSPQDAQKQAPAKPSKLVQGCDPLLLVEYEKNEISALPRRLYPIPANSVGGAQLGFVRLEIGGWPFGFWFLSKEGVEKTLRRRIRLGVMRLHAEHQALGAILTMVSQEKIPYEPNSTESDALDTYLQNAMKILSRMERAGIDLEAIRDVIAADALVDHDALKLLQGRLKEVRKQIRTKVQIYAQVSASRRAEKVLGNLYVINAAGDVTVEDKSTQQTNNLTITGGNFAGAIVGINQHFERVSQRIAQSTGSAELKSSLDEMQSLSKQIVEKLAAKGETEKAETVAKRLDQFTTEAASPKPDKSFLKMTSDGLIEAAKTVAEMTPSILSVVTKILGLFP